MSESSPDDADARIQRVITERPVRRVGVGEHARRPEVDQVAVEAPLEIRVAGEPLAVTMRTPGEDRYLALGFLLAEGVVKTLADVGTVAHCGRLDDEGYGNTIDVGPGPGFSFDTRTLEDTRRGTLTTASCGVCGRRSIEDLLARIEPLGDQARVPADVLLAAPASLASRQESFARTGGAHAAAALQADGRYLAHAEDVGRHNAVDKVVGMLLYGGTLDQAVVLAVSGRVSFEIVQKAAAARIPVIAAVSAPTSLAIDLAARAEITLAAFVREGRMNVYTGSERLN